MKEVQVIENQIVVANDLLMELKEWQAYKKKMEAKESKVKSEILKAMKKHNIKSFENEVIKITYVPETTKKSIDTDMMKALGVYDDFLTETTKSEYITMSFKKDAKNAKK